MSGSGTPVPGPGRLAALLEVGPRPPREAAARCRAALTEAGVPLAGLLGLRPLAGSERLLGLAAVWATLELAERLDERGLDGLAALVVDAGDPRLLARALALPLGLGSAARAERSGSSLRADLIAAVRARRDERRLGHHASRRELAAHLVPRGRALPRAWLDAFGGATERRERLLDRGVLAAELARDLGRFGGGLGVGRLALAGEDLERERVPTAELGARPTSARLRRAFAAQVAWAREQLALAWALPHDLGPRHAWWASAWLRAVEGRLRLVEDAGLDLVGRDLEPAPARRLGSMVLGALWWLPPRSVGARGPTRRG